MTPKAFSALNKETYKNRGFLERWLCRLRPFICPFEDLLVHIPEKATLFDIGCGNGVFINFSCHFRNVSQATGVDVNDKALENAQKSMTSFPVHFQKADQTKDWPEAGYDVVSMIDVMHHVPPSEQQAFLQEALRKVKPQGRLIYKDMAKKPFFYAMMNRLHDLVLARQWINYYDIGDVAEVLQRNGFKVQHQSVKTCFWYRHELIVADRL